MSNYINVLQNFLMVQPTLHKKKQNLKHETTTLMKKIELLETSKRFPPTRSCFICVFGMIEVIFQENLCLIINEDIFHQKG